MPEVNPEAANTRPRGIISVPNCTTLSLIVPLAALHRAFGLRELFAASYQAASGAGQAGIEALYDQLAKVGGNRTARAAARRPARRSSATAEPFSAPLALNVIPWAGIAAGRRLVLGGAEDPQRDPQDPRPAGPADLRDLRPGPGRHRPLLALHAVFGREVTGSRRSRC